MLTGELPEHNRKVAAQLAEYGFDDFTGYVVWVCEQALERGILPHTNLGVLAGEDLARLREVTASRQVPGACTAAVLDADAYAPMPWLASTFVFGPSLGTAMAASGVLPEASVRRLAAGLATALVEIHQAGLIHRDLKPDNVLLAEDGVRVIDFGIARAAETGTATELTQSGWVVGTPGFMSPEQAEGSDLTPASDVFSLGSVLAMAATGRSPFAGPGTPQTLYNLVHAAPDLNGVPPGLRGIIEPCLAKDPAARPTPRQLLEMIGLLAPSDRHWPPVVQELTAVQRAQIDRLLSTGFLPVAPPPPSPPPRRRTGTPAPARRSPSPRQRPGATACGTPRSGTGPPCPGLG